MYIVFAGVALMKRMDEIANQSDLWKVGNIVSNNCVRVERIERKESNEGRVEELWSTKPSSTFGLDQR